MSEDKPDRFRPKAAVHPTAREVSELLEGTLMDAPPDEMWFSGLATLEAAGADEISFVASLKYLKGAQASNAGLLLVPASVELPGRARVQVKGIWPAVAKLMGVMYPNPVPAAGVHPTAVLGCGVRLGRDVSIGPYCVLGDEVEIGDGTALGPHCSIEAACTVGAGSRFHAHVSLQGIVNVGSRVILHSGVVLGADGFRYEAGERGILKIPQVGRVLIEDDVEIGANTTIDRAFLGETRIGQGSKIDNQVQIGHNCNIGRFCIIAACCAMGGSTTLEDGCIMGGACALAEGLTIGKGSFIGGGSALGRDFPPGSIISGYPARLHRDYYKIQAHLQRLPLLVERVKNIEEKLKQAE